MSGTRNGSKLFLTFAGNYVSLVMKNMRGKSNTKIANLMLAGYLLEECDDYYYLGETPEEAAVAVRKSDVAAVMMASELEESIEIPDDFEVQ